MRKTVIGTLGFLAVVGGGCLDSTDESTSSQLVQMSGAVFTTNRDGTRVDQNIYASKPQVWLDGGPGPNAPVGAAGLPAGFYFFQVTDPSGKTVLSTDPVGCRRVQINASGVISAYVPLVVPGVTCFHLTDVDTDHAAQGARTVQLIPFNDTPNPGGEYKVWLSPDSSFPNNQSKTDNFKVLAPAPVCGNGIVEDGEQCDDGNNIDNDGCSNACIPCPPPPVCGNGIVEDGEQCDDGNNIDNDMCSNSCVPCPVVNL